MRICDAVLCSALRKDLGVHIDSTLLTWGPDSTPKQVACYSLLASLTKKLVKSQKIPKHLQKQCWEDFKSANNRCESWELLLNTSLDEVLWGGFVDHFRKTFDMASRENPEIRYDYGSIYRAGRAGPGASVLAAGGDFYTKHFAGPLSASRRFLPIWELVADRCFGPLDRAAEETREANHGPAVCVEASVFGCVPKNNDKARSTSTEPGLNMFFQLGLGSMIEARLKSRFDIDIRGDLSNQQVRNRALARVGSIGGELATVDLSEASNTIPLRMFSELCRQAGTHSLHSIVHVLRSSRTFDPRSREEVSLHMVSTMGNGFTFPLMTAILACVVYSVYDTLDISPIDRRNGRRLVRFGVFGDDIIVDRRAIPRLYRLLELLGFHVNTDKSFVDGLFKESCGADFFAGYNVRGVYLKSLDTRNDLFKAVNALVRWSACHNVSLRNTLGVLLSEFDGDIAKWAVPLHESDDAGLAIPLSGTGLVRHCRNGLTRYRCFEPQKWEFILAGSVAWTYRGQKRRSYNPHGHIIAALFGTYRDGFITLRPRRVKYRRTNRITLNWDYFDPNKLGFGLTLSIRQLATVWRRDVAGDI